MDQTTLLNLALVLAFVLVGGVFAGTEIALVSLRDSQIDRLERLGARGARAAAVARDPNRFLAAVQIGVTVAGFLSAAYGAATLAPDFTPILEDLGLGEGPAETLALVTLTLLIAYLSLVLGELVPKRFALQRAAGVALVVGPPLDRFASAMRPAVWFLSASTNAVVRLLGGDPAAKGEEMSDEELREMVIAHEGLPDHERRILNEVFTAGERSLGEVMRPRRDVVALPAGTRVAEARAAVRDSPYSRYPLYGDSIDEVLGFFHVRDLLDAADEAPVRTLMRPLLQLPATKRLLPTLALMQSGGAHIAVVVDEYGGTDGIVTLEDLVEELVGDIRDEYDEADDRVRVRADGQITVEAGLTIEEFAQHTGVTLPDGPYETAAGFVLSRLGRIAEVGDSVTVAGRTLAVSEMDERRIARLVVGDPTDPGPGGADTPPDA
jgi:putative hemolysin